VSYATHSLGQVTETIVIPRKLRDASVIEGLSAALTSAIRGVLSAGVEINAALLTPAFQALPSAQKESFNRRVVGYDEHVRSLTQVLRQVARVSGTRYTLATGIRTGSEVTPQDLVDGGTVRATVLTLTKLQANMRTWLSDLGAVTGQPAAPQRPGAPEPESDSRPGMSKLWLLAIGAPLLIGGTYAWRRRR
jgi:hypothetical protein